jgi:hypothetical protein
MRGDPATLLKAGPTLQTSSVGQGPPYKTIGLQITISLQGKARMASMPLSTTTHIILNIIIRLLNDGPKEKVLKKDFFCTRDR